MDKTEIDTADELARRKAQLLRQGEFYRVSIVHAKAQVKQGVRPEAIFQHAIEHAGVALRVRVDSLLHPTGANAASVMPYAVTAIGFLARRQLLKPALGALAVVAALAWWLRQKRAREVAY